MKVFHSNAPQSTLQDVYQTIQDDLGKSTNELFSSFEEVPLGTASLAQVHKATLEDGRTVAVKVQHRDVQEHVTIDIYTIEVKKYANFLLRACICYSEKKLTIHCCLFLTNYILLFCAVVNKCCFLDIS